MIKKVFFWSLVAFAAPVAASSPPSYPYLPNNNQWTGENVYQGSKLILAYYDGNASKFTPEQVTQFEMTASWMSGAAQAFGAISMFDQTPRGTMCKLHIEKMTLVDVARRYANYWTASPAHHSPAALVVLANAMYAGHPCH